MTTSFSRTSFSRPLSYVLASMLAVALVGCGDSDSSNNESSNSTPNAAIYDGTGTEALGSYVGRVSAASGLYTTSHYAPVGLTEQVSLSLSGVNLGLSTYNSSVAILAANDTDKTYTGTTTWTPTEGTLSGIVITETWTLSFSDDGVELNVSATTPGADVGALTLTLSDNSYSFDDSTDSEFQGRTIESSADARFIGVTSQLELNDNDPGTYGYIYIDGTYNWNDSYYFDAFVRDGDTLTAGGFSDSTGYVGDEYIDNFATITIKLDSLGRPASTEITVNDYDVIDDDMATDVEPASFTIKANDYHYYDDFYAATYFNQSSYVDLTVVSVAPAGGLLETKFGVATTVVASAFLDHADHVHFAGSSMDGGYVSPTEREFVVWDGRFNDFANDDSAYNFDSLATTQERLTVNITYNASHVATNGTVKLEVYDVNDVLTSTEDMTFTLAPIP